MKDLQLVIFDMDGLLFDTERIYFRAFQRAAKELGYDFPFETYLKVVGVTDEKGKEILSSIYGEGAKILKAFHRYPPLVDQIVEEEGIPIKPGVHQLLDTLDEMGIKKCIASSSPPEVIERNIKKTGLDDRFDFLISGTEVKHGKPSPDIFLEAMKRANVKNEKALVLEDSYHGLQAAVRAGIRCIIIPDLLEPSNEMQRLAYRIFGDLGKVAEFIKKG